jgi:hypothetical protein
MTVFARSDVGGITVNVNGHEHVHERRLVGREKLPSSEFRVDCPECEVFLLATFPDQWSGKADQVPLTPDEAAKQERYEQEGSVLTASIARSIADQATALAGGRNV